MNRVCLLTSGLLALAAWGAATAGALEVVLTVDVPPGTELKIEDVKLAALPAGKSLALVLYADWGYHTAKSALPLAEAFAASGWRGTFFLAGAPDIKEYAPKLEALGQEVATNLFSGGIQAYRDEMFSYSTQDIFNAIGPLRAELNAVLKSPVVTQLVRGHDVPYRDRIRQMGYLEGTHWYTHYVFLGRGPRDEMRLGGRGAPVVRVSGLNEAAFEQAEKEKALAIIFGEDSRSYSGSFKDFLAKHGGKKEHWYTTLGELAASVYLRQKAKVSSVNAEAGKARVTLTLAEDFNPVFLRAPIGLQLGPVVVDVRPEAVLGGQIQPQLAFSEPRIRLPGRTELGVELANLEPSKLTVKSLSVHGGDDFDVSEPMQKAGRSGGSFVIRSNAKAGPQSFGFVPFLLTVKCEGAGGPRTLLAAAELEVRPALSVDVYPHDGVPVAPKGSQTFMMTVDNIRAGPGRGNWGNLRPKFERFILPPEGEVKGTISFPESDAFEVEPRQIPLQLPAEGGSQTFYVTVTNTGPVKDPYLLRPLIRLAGEEQALLLPFAGTRVHHVAELGSAPLDEKGLLMYASWDKLEGGSSPGVDLARGKKASYQGAMGPGRIGPGLLGQALLHNTVCLLDPFLNLREAEGTVMFWLRNDPSQDRPLPARGQERLFAASTQHPARDVGTSLLYLGLGENYLLARMMTLGPTYHQVRAPFRKTDEWSHVALSWSCARKFMRIVVDGEVRGELKGGEESWHPVPARCWPYSYGDFMTPLSDDHGTYTSTMRDEFYIYNRPLGAEEIQQHIRDVKAKAAPQGQEKPS